MSRQAYLLVAFAATTIPVLAQQPVQPPDAGLEQPGTPHTIVQWRISGRRR